MTIINQKSISGITSITTAAAGDNLLTVHTNDGSERLRVTSDGKVGINTDMGGAPASLYPFSVYRSTGTGYVYTETAESGASAGLRAKAGTSDFTIFTTQGTGQLAVYDNTNTAERLRIDSSGNVGIVNNSPSNYSSTGRNLVIGAGSGAAGLTVASGATNTGNIYFAAGSTGDDQVRGQIRYNHSTEAMDLYTDASLRMRIDSSGDVQARRARSNTAGDVALSVQPSDSTIHYGLRIDSTNNSLNLDRASGTAANLLTIDSSGNFGLGTDSPTTLIHGQVSSGSAITTLESTATSGEASVSLKGKNSSGTVRTGIFKYDNADRFRIATTAAIPISFETNDTERMRIHGGGTVSIPVGVELGSGIDGTSANTLDDYEEGTWTPTVSSAGSVTGEDAKYTKIGNLVHVYGKLTSFTNRSSSNTIVITSLPFTASTNQAGGSMFARYADRTAYTVYVYSNKIEFYSIGSGNFTSLQHSHLNNDNAVIYFQATYNLA